MANGDRLSRRIFLANAGKLAAGAAAGAAGLSMVAGSQGATVASAADVPQWPWPYQKLDPEAVYWKANAGYYDNG